MSAWIDVGSPTPRSGDGAGSVGPSWGRASVLTFDTDRGRLWAKAVPDVFSTRSR
jgi:hypothetical protein